MANRRGRQAHAYSPHEIEKLKGVPLPERIKCGRCNKSMGQARYSEKQLTDYRWQIKNGLRDPKLPFCQKCAGGNQLVELECTMCHKTKGLEEFAKCQRNVPDTAQCFKCTEDQVTHQPYNEDRYDDPYKPFVTADTSNGIAPDYWSSSNSTHGSSVSHDWATVNGDTTESSGGVPLSNHFQRAMSLNGSASDSLIGSEYSAYPTPVNNGNGSEVQTGSWHTRSTGPASTGRTGSTNSGFNPNAYGRPPTASNAGTERTYASSRVERSEASEVRSNRWARIPAYRALSPPSRGVPSPTSSAGPVRSPLVRPDGNAQRETESDTDPWDSDSGGDDSDGDNTVI